MTQLAISTMQFACAVLVLSSAGIASAQSSPTPAGRTKSAAARAALMKEIHDSLRAVLRAAVTDSAFPGAFAIVGDSRGVLAEHGDGRIDWPQDAPRPTRHTIWDVASLTKVVGTTTALAQLVERGRVDLDAPVRRYLPEWPADSAGKVTVRHLLTHTSGLPSFKPYDRITQEPDSIAALLFGTQLERAPGDSMIYSDIGAFMMGRIVERVSGQRLDRYLARHVFRPLSMTGTMFNPPRNVYARVAPTEIDTLRGGLVRGKVHDERAYYLGGVAAHAGLFSTAGDLSRFAAMLLRGGRIDRARILKPETIRLFTAYADSGRHNRALGWQKAPTAWAGTMMSSRAFGHTGFTGTSMAIDPALDVYIILLSNRVNPTRSNPRITGVRQRLADAIMSVVRRNRGLTSTAGNP